MKKWTLTLIIASFLASTSITQANEIPSPEAQYTYMEEGKCLKSISSLVGSSERLGLVTTAMLGRLPACEVEKIVIAMNIGKVNFFIERRKKAEAE